jgi:hypothetical protein
MKNISKLSGYKSSTGQMVTVYETPKGTVLVCQGRITVMFERIDSICTAPSVEAAQEAIGWSYDNLK